MTAATVASGGTLQFNGATAMLGPYTVLNAQAGGSVQFQNAAIDGGNLSGLGTFLLAGSTANVLNGTTIDTTIQQSGPATFINVTNNGVIAGSGGLVLGPGGDNAGGGSILLSGANATSSWGGNGGVISIANGSLLNNSGGSLTSWGGQILIASGGTLNADSAAQGRCARPARRRHPFAEQRRRLRHDHRPAGGRGHRHGELRPHQPLLERRDRPLRQHAGDGRGDRHGNDRRQRRAGGLRYDRDRRHDRGESRLKPDAVGQPLGERPVGRGRTGDGGSQREQ